MEAFAIAKRHRVPLAPVRDVDQVMRDHHMHERGMLEWIEHDEIGRIVASTTPLRIHGADPVDTVPSPKPANTIARSPATGSACHPPRSLRSSCRHSYIPTPARRRYLAGNGQPPPTAILSAAFDAKTQITQRDITVPIAPAVLKTTVATPAQPSFQFEIEKSELPRTPNPQSPTSPPEVARRGIPPPTTRSSADFLKAYHASAHSVDDYGFAPGHPAFCIGGRQVEVAPSHEAAHCGGHRVGAASSPSAVISRKRVT
jgi:hypothetical protein